MTTVSHAVLPVSEGTDARIDADAPLRALRADVLAHCVKFGESVDKQGQRLDWGLDLREVLYRPAWLKTASALLWEQIRHWRPDAIGGMTLSAEQLTAGLLRAALDDGRDVTGFSVRREAKAYGMRRRIEGVAPGAGTRVAIVDDLIDSGWTARTVARLVEQRGATVAGYAAAVDFGSRGCDARLGTDVPRAALFSLDDFGILQAAFVPRRAPSWRADGLNRGGYTAPQSTPLVDAEGTVAAGDTGTVIAWDRAGARRWCFSIGASAHGIRSAIEAVGDTLLFAGYDGCVCRLRRADGAALWVRRVGAFVGASLAIDRAGGRVFAAACLDGERRSCEFVSLDLEGGEVAWRTRAPAWSYARPALVPDDGVVFAANDGRIRCLGRADGGVRWTLDAGAPVKGWIIADEHACYFGSFDGYLWAVAAADGSIVWRRRLAEWLLVHPALAGPLLLAGAARHLCAFDRHDGTLRWTRESGRVTGLAVTPDQRWALGGNDGGDCFCIDAHTGQYRWRFRADGAFRATPGTDGARCVIPCYDGSLYAFDLDA